MSSIYDIINQHSYHPATPETARAHDRIRQASIDLALSINACVPEGPEKDEAQKALHVVRMWANMGIAVHGAPVATEDQRTTPQPTQGQT